MDEMSFPIRPYVPYSELPCELAAVLLEQNRKFYAWFRESSNRPRRPLRAPSRPPRRQHTGNALVDDALARFRRNGWRYRRRLIGEQWTRRRVGDPSDRPARIAARGRDHRYHVAPSSGRRPMRLTFVETADGYGPPVPPGRV